MVQKYNIFYITIDGARHVKNDDLDIKLLEYVSVQILYARIVHHFVCCYGNCLGIFLLFPFQPPIIHLKLHNYPFSFFTHTHSNDNANLYFVLQYIINFLKIYI